MSMAQRDMPWATEKMLCLISVKTTGNGNGNSNNGRLRWAVAPRLVTAFLLVKNGASGALGRAMVRAHGLSKIWPQYKTLASQPLTKSLLTFFSSSSAHRDPVRDPSCKRTNASSLPSSRLPSDTLIVSETRIISKTTIPQPSRWVRTYVSPPTTLHSLATANSDATSRCCSHHRARPGMTRHPTDNPTGQDSHQRRGHRPRRLWQVDHHWSLDLPVRRYRQAYHREVREGRLVNITVTEHATWPSILHLNHQPADARAASPCRGAHFHPSLWIFHFQCECGVRLSGGGLISYNQNPVTSLTQSLSPPPIRSPSTPSPLSIQLVKRVEYYADPLSTQPPSLARVPSSTPGFWTS